MEGKNKIVKASSMFNNDASIKSYYAARAQEYDRVYEKPERQSDIQRLKNWLPPFFTGRRLIEIACGTGFWTQFIAPVASEVVALDASPETMAIARHRVTEGKISFMVGDAYCLPKDIGTFNAAFAGFWLSHVPKNRQQEFFVGLGKILEPGAIVLLLDNLYVEGSNHPISECDEDGNTYQMRKLDDGSSHRVLKNFPTEAELLALIDGLGVEVSYTKLDYYWTIKYAATKF